MLLQMAYQRKVKNHVEDTDTKTAQKDINEEGIIKPEPQKDRTTIVVFIGLLLDLLGNNIPNEKTLHYNIFPQLLP